MVCPSEPTSSPPPNRLSTDVGADGATNIGRFGAARRAPDRQICAGRSPYWRSSRGSGTAAVVPTLGRWYPPHDERREQYNVPIGDALLDVAEHDRVARVIGAADVRVDEFLSQYARDVSLRLDCKGNRLGFIVVALPFVFLVAALILDAEAISSK
jgi:hypothetical protein